MLNQQRGVGLLEVMIALLLLALAVLGFSAMQMRAVKATDETLYRSDAMVAIRNISEDLRLYPSMKQRKEYQDYISSKPNVAPKNCNTNPCTEVEQMKFNAYQSIKLAKDSGIELNARTCPGTQGAVSLQKMCIVAAWGETTPTMEGSLAKTSQDCTDEAGVYRPGATCFVVETY